MSHRVGFWRLVYLILMAYESLRLAAMFFDFSHIGARNAYKLLASSVVPRPIALISSLNEQGVLNAAPYSFFNAIGSDPALVVIGISDAETGKDTGRNIAVKSEFVVNLVSVAMSEAMNICAIDFPSDQSEVAASHLNIAKCALVSVPRLADSPVSLECREHTTLHIGNNLVVIGEVMGLWIEDEFVDKEKFHVDTNSLDLIGRMGGAGGYTETRQTFEIPRISYEQWSERNHPLD